jgi:hypothetical protein
MLTESPLKNPPLREYKSHAEAKNETLIGVEVGRQLTRSLCFGIARAQDPGEVDSKRSGRSTTTAVHAAGNFDAQDARYYRWIRCPITSSSLD